MNTTATETDLVSQPSMSAVGQRNANKHLRQAVGMSNEAIHNLRRQLRIGDVIILHLLGVQGHVDGDATVSVTAVTETFFRVRLDSNDDEGEFQVLEFPGDDGDIASATILNNMPGVPRFNYSVYGALTQKPDWLIYVDGSCAQNQTGRAPSAAAIVIKHLASNTVWISARFSPASTNNVCEWAAMVAACRVSVCLNGRVAIVGDAMNVVRGLDGSFAVKAPHLTPYLHEATGLKDAGVGRVTFHQMDGHKSPQKQLADVPAKLAVTLQKDFCCSTKHDNLEKDLALPYDTYSVPTTAIRVPGFHVALPPPEKLFPVLAEISTAPRKTRATITEEMRVADAAAFASAEPFRVTSLAEYIRIRSFPARPEPPREVREQWAAMVLTATQRVTGESDPDKRNQAMLDLMILPNIWLPASQPTRQVVKHFQRGVPFSIDLRRERAPVAVKAQEKRLAEMIMRKSKNRDLRGAVQVLRSECEASGPQLSDEEKLAALKKKFPTALKQPLAHAFKDETLPTFQTPVLHSVMKKMKRTSAPCIDGWQKGHLRFAISSNDQVADAFCCLGIQILREQFSPVVMECLRAARLVGLPKPDGGVRPIAVSNFFLKVIGLMCIRLSGATCGEWQYAVGKLNGTKELVHRLRRYKQEGKVIGKFDIENAYNELPRAVVERALMTQSAYLKAYFRTVYYKSSAMVVYRKDGHDIIEAPDGVRQGDAASTLKFCKGLDLAIPEVLQKCQEEDAIIHDVLLYADDLNFVCPDAYSMAVVAKWAPVIFLKYGLKVSLSAGKSACIIPPTDPYWKDPTIREVFAALEYSGLSYQDEFVALGADIGTCVDLGETRSFFEKQLAKQKKFFALLDRVNSMDNIHPAVLFTLLRLCGNPRLEYLCSVMPPSIGLQAILEDFDSSVRRVLNGPCLMRGRLAMNNPLIYAAEGTGIVNYKAISGTLFSEAQRQAFTSGQQRGTPAAALALTPTATSKDAALPVQRRGYDSAWMFHTSSPYELSPAEFVINLGLRLQMLPEPLPHVIVCDCHATITDPVSFMDHVLKCDRSTNFGFKPRHDTVVNDALIPVAKSYGINCTVEPTCYTYKDGHAKRPDIIFHTVPKIATDVTIVFPSPDGVGVAACVAAREKTLKHEEAVAALGHEFIPCAMEITGVLDDSVQRLMRSIARSLTPSLRHGFHHEMNHAVQVALARGRANALISAIAKQRSADGSVRFR